MAEVASSARAPQTSRIRAMVFPREHGGWGLLLIPLFAGACIGFPHARQVGDFVWFLVAALAVFWLRTPVEALVGLGVMRVHTAQERRAVLKAIAAITPVVVVSSAALFWRGRNTDLLLLAAAAGASFAAQHILRMQGRRARLISQFAGAVGLTSTAAGAYYCVTGRMDATALAAWFAFWLFACDQIHYVHVRIENARTVGVKQRAVAAVSFLSMQVVMVAAVVAASWFGLLPTYAVVAFLPIVVRGLLWLVDRDTSLDVKWLGMTELLQGVSFGVVFAATFFVRS